jgi:hypothetical protein
MAVCRSEGEFAVAMALVDIALSLPTLSPEEKSALTEVRSEYKDGILPNNSTVTSPCPGDVEIQPQMYAILCSTSNCKARLLLVSINGVAAAWLEEFINMTAPPPDVVKHLHQDLWLP